jgi:hypothetical protein
MMETVANTVLSFSYEMDLLSRREEALRQSGYNVFSSSSEICIRFEIQMGQCGVLLLCYTIREAIHGDLAGLFNRQCPGGVIAFVMHPVIREKSPHAHVCLLDFEFPNKLHLIEAARVRRRKTA